jgi:fructose-bisphosphate aldolase class II
MPVVSPAQYVKMLEKAKQEKFAFPAFNVTSTETANAVLLGLKTAGADGIIQVSTGGAEFMSGLGVKDMAKGAIALADYVHYMAQHYDVNVALHTDHCHPKYLEGFVLPLIAETERRRAAGRPNLFNAHMFDGSELALGENITRSAELLWKSAWWVVKKTATTPAMWARTSSTPPPRTWWPCTRGSAPSAATCWPPPSAMCMAFISRAMWC